MFQLSAVVGETSPNDETFKTSLWWLQRSAALLRPDVCEYDENSCILLIIFFRIN